jgi:hypothetical protein
MEAFESKIRKIRSTIEDIRQDIESIKNVIIINVRKIIVKRIGI